MTYLSVFTKSQQTTMQLRLMNFALSPKVCFKRNNLILLEYILGHTASDDIATFLTALIEALQLPHVGIQVHQGYTAQEILLRAYITLVAANMPCHQKLRGSLPVA